MICTITSSVRDEGSYRDTGDNYAARSDRLDYDSYIRIMSI